MPKYMYMPMGEAGMAEMQDMTAMGMSLPENTLPMMTGEGPFGPIEMGETFTVLKVRDNIKKGDYTDPGWYGASARDRGVPARLIHFTRGKEPL